MSDTGEMPRGIDGSRFLQSVRSTAESSVERSGRFGPPARAACRTIDRGRTEAFGCGRQGLGRRDRRVLRAKRCPLANSGLPERFIAKKVISHAEDVRPYRHAHVQHGCIAACRRCTEVEVAK